MLMRSNQDGKPYKWSSLWRLIRGSNNGPYIRPLTPLCRSSIRRTGRSAPNSWLGLANRLNIPIYWLTNSSRLRLAVSSSPSINEVSITLGVYLAHRIHMELNRGLYSLYSPSSSSYVKIRSTRCKKASFTFCPVTELVMKKPVMLFFWMNWLIKSCGK